MIVKERLQPGAWTPPWLRHQHVARYRWAVDQCRGSLVLDAACGNGYGSRILKEGGSVISADIAAEAIADARAIAGSRDLQLALADTTGLPFPDGAFGAYVSFETIEHVRDDAAYVAEARRVLRKGGLFLCSTPNRRIVNPGNTIADAPFNPFHVREYTMSELESVLRKSFDHVTLLGQREYGDVYANALETIGRRWKMGAVRMHQLRKLISIPLDGAPRHWPTAVRRGGQPEVLVAVCR